MTTTPAYTPGTTLVLLGTKRGLFAVTSADRETWTSAHLGLTGDRIYYSMLDQRQGKRLFAADNNDFFGSFVKYSDDFGQTWQEPERGIQFPAETGELREFVNIFVGSENARFLSGLETPVTSGATIHILQSVAGG